MKSGVTERGVEVKGGVTERGVEVRECEERGDTEK